MRRVTALVGWSVVVVVGAGVLGLIFGFSLFPRLTAGQAVVDRLSPAFTPAAASASRAGIDYLSTAVTTLDPIVTAKGGAADEIAPFVAFVAKNANLTDQQVLDAVKKDFPHVYALLNALPLATANEEVPALVATIAKALGTTPEATLGVLKSEYPHLYQAVANLPTVVNGWEQVPGTEKLTRFAGSPARSAVQVRDYYSGDVIPVVENHSVAMGQLANWQPKVKDFPPLLTVIGGLAFGLGLLMLVFSIITTRGRGIQIVAWTAVLAVGATVVGLVFGLQLFDRLSNGGKLVEAAAPIFTDDRLAGDVASISFVSSIVDLADPIVNEEGGAAADVDKLVTAVATKLNAKPEAVVATLKEAAPHATALLEALPLSKVSEEIPGLITFIASKTKLTEAQVLQAFTDNFPHLAQAVTNLPAVTAGWNAVPGISPDSPMYATMHNATGVRDYFGGTVIPALAASQKDFQELNGHWPPLWAVPMILMAIGVVVILWGFIFLMNAIGFGRWRSDSNDPRSALPRN